MEELTLEEKRKKKSERKRERELSDIRFILLRPEGRRFIWRVLEEGRVFHDAYTPDSNTTYYNLGRQSISRDFMNDILAASPDAMSHMSQERDAEDKIELLKEQEEQERTGVLP